MPYIYIFLLTTSDIMTRSTICEKIVIYLSLTESISFSQTIMKYFATLLT